MRFALAVIVALAWAAGVSGFVCRTWPYGTVSDRVVRDDICDCCDCSDEPGSDLPRGDCPVNETTLAAARMMKERTHRKTKKTKLPDVASLVKDAASKHRERARMAEENKNVAEAREAIVHARIRRERTQVFSKALDKVAAESTTEQIRRMVAALATSFNESSAEWVVDAITKAGLSHVDRTDAVALGGTLAEASALFGREFDNTTRADAMERALGLDVLDREGVIRAWKAALMHGNGTMMIPEASLSHLPEHWNATAFPTLDAADEARAVYVDAKKDEEDATKLERAHENKKTIFNFGPNRSFTTLDGKCFDVKPPVQGELGYKLERPSEICFYRFARYSKFSAEIVDLRTAGAPVPTMLFTDKDTIKACTKEGGHKTLVSFVCFTEDMFLFTEPLSRCAMNVTYGTPLGC